MFRLIQSRSFVSSALLTRAWKEETLVQLRKEAKVRGTKAVLITRLEEYDKSQAHISEPIKSRVMSTHAAHVNTSEAPGNPEISTPSNSAAAFAVKIPNTNFTTPEPLAQVPYVPDFWGSSLPKTDSASEDAIPQILVVAGSETHPSGGPAHHHRDATMYDEQQSSSAPSTTSSGGLFDDMADDVGLPRPAEVKSSFWKMFSS
ncbi:hypothetical protein CVT24_003402 [Panaeolus cyanescens]|uniref:SAP domain-containing protein n=1 Tax=Panaeolus cyanescens TaxID=181874 RepID=A0A409Y7C7_9AGAR|nr:hypothetical protein CVT24_003402 [Panaeolus cyanescens]